MKKAFDEEDIEIPWPHTKVFFGNAPEIGTKELIEQKLPAKAEAQQPRKRKRQGKLPPS